MALLVRAHPCGTTEEERRTKTSGWGSAFETTLETQMVDWLGDGQRIALHERKPNNHAKNTSFCVNSVDVKRH